MALPMEKKEVFTFADYLTWDEGGRMEIISGIPVMMGTPTTTHQRISGELFAQIHDRLKGKPCEVFHAPFSVRPFEREGDRPEHVRTVVEPDLTVVCDPGKIDEYGCKGAPDLIIEILLPSTARRDRLEKFDLYQRAWVREYWIVDPDTRTVQVYSLEEGRYCAPQIFIDTVKSGVLEDCVIDLRDVFPV